MQYQDVRKIYIFCMHGVIWSRFTFISPFTILVKRTVFFQKYGNEALARGCWSKAMELEPYNAYVCHALSNLEKRQRNFVRARDVLEEVVRHKPTSALCVSLSDLERQLGNPNQAKKMLIYGMENCDAERSKLLLSLAWLEEDVFHNRDEAVRLIAEAMKIDENNVRVHVAKASMELRFNRVDDARKTLLHACSLQAEDGQHYTMLGTLELESGNVNAARKVLENGAKLYPGDQFLLQRWGTLEARYGNGKLARQLFEKSVLIQPHAPTFVAWAILEEKDGHKV
jgi:Tfp pilus assembly protein PilF